MSETDETENMEFTLQCIGEDEVRTRDVKGFLHALLSETGLLSGRVTSLQQKRGGILRGERAMIRVYPFPLQEMLDGDIVAFTVTASSGDEDVLDGIKLRLVDLVNNMGFTSVRIMRDDHSQRIAERLYGKLYSLETKTRAFIAVFFARHLGPGWPKAILPESIKSEIDANERKGNDRTFVRVVKVPAGKAGKEIEREIATVKKDLMFAYFSHLGIILSNKNEYLFEESRQKKPNLAQLVAEAVDLAELKKEVQGGTIYQYIYEYFIKGEFPAEWSRLSYYRNKVAHSGILTARDEDNADALIKKLSMIVKVAQEGLDAFKLKPSYQKGKHIELERSAIMQLASDEKDAGGYDSFADCAQDNNINANLPFSPFNQMLPYPPDVVPIGQYLPLGYFSPQRSITAETIKHEFSRATTVLGPLTIRVFVRGWLVRIKGYNVVVATDAVRRLISSRYFTLNWDASGNGWLSLANETGSAGINCDQGDASSMTDE